MWSGFSVLCILVHILEVSQGQQLIFNEWSSFHLLKMTWKKNTENTKNQFGKTLFKSYVLENVKSVIHPLRSLTVSEFKKILSETERSAFFFTFECLHLGKKACHYSLSFLFCVFRGVICAPPPTRGPHHPKVLLFLTPPLSEMTEKVISSRKLDYLNKNLRRYC